MFTGLIEELGEVLDISNKGSMVNLKVKAKKVLQDTKIGQSIATNGVCLTATDLSDYYFTADIMITTLNATNLSRLKIGDKVNLERALKPTDRLDGHIVQGHIDGTGYIRDIQKGDNIFIIEISADKEILKYIINKGSIAIDGISLTAAEKLADSFKVSLIPQTIEDTNLKYKSIGDELNLEVDLIGKYVESLLGYKEEKEDLYQLIKNF